MLDAIRKIEKRGAVEMARRVMQMASAVFRYGVATSRCARDPTADLRGALKAAGPVKHRSAIKQEELPGLLAALDFRFRHAADGDCNAPLALAGRLAAKVESEVEDL